MDCNSMAVVASCHLLNSCKFSFTLFDLVALLYTPHNIMYMCAGRLFDCHVLDMIELGIESFRSLHEFKVTT